MSVVLLLWFCLHLALAVQLSSGGDGFEFKISIGYPEQMSAYGTDDLSTDDLTAAQKPEENDDEVLYVYNLVRHGARAPFKELSIYKLPPKLSKQRKPILTQLANMNHTFSSFEVDAVLQEMVEMEQELDAYVEEKIERDFGVPTQMMTAAGLRQRYMLGRYNAAKYPDLLKQERIFVQSTGRYRTLQSAYAEILAYEDLTNVILTEKQSKQEAKLPFQTRRQKAKSSKLGQKMPDGYVPIPVYSVGNGFIDDDKFSCSKALRMSSTIKKKLMTGGYDNSTKAAHRDLFNKLQPVLTDSYNFTASDYEKMNWGQLYVYADLMMASIFQGRSMNHTFKDSEVDAVQETLKLFLTESTQYDKDVAAMYADRFLQQPLLKMDEIVNGVAEPQFFEVSGHDNMVGNVWAYLDPNSFKQKDRKWFGIPYSSNLSIELHRKDAKYFMRLLANEQTLTFDGLESDDGLIPYDAAKKWFNAKSYQGLQYDFAGLAQACAVDPTLYRALDRD